MYIAIKFKLHLNLWYVVVICVNVLIETSVSAVMNIAVNIENDSALKYPDCCWTKLDKSW